MKPWEFPRQCLLLTLIIFLSVHVQKSLSSPSPMLVKLTPVKVKAGNELRRAPAPVSVSSFPVLLSAASASGGAESVVPGPKVVGVNRTRIAEVRPYRIQRKLSPPTSSEMYLFNDNNSMERYSDNNTTKRHREKDRKPKRKLLHYIPSGLSKTVNNVKLKRTNSKVDRLGSDRLTEKMKAKLKNAMKEFEEDLKLKQLTRQSILMHDDNEEDPYGYLHYPHHSHSHSHTDTKDETGVKTRYSNYAIDPAHPAVLAITQHNPLAPFRPIPPSTDFSHPELLPGPPKKKKRIELPSSLLPLDKTLLYTGMAFSWVFWLIVALSYYSWGDISKDSSYSSSMPWISIERRKSEQQQLKMSQKPIIVKLEPGKPAQFFQTRALQGNSFNFARVLDMIAMAQETYEKFDFQSIDCQKKALCELQQKQADFGETGRKISSTFSFMDTLEGLPMPAIIQAYLKEYKEAIMQGKNSSKECSAIYPKCGFSIKEVFVKYTKKAHKQQ